MNYTATFSSKGQLTFPAELRRKLGIKAGQKVIIKPHKTDKNTYTVTPAKKTMTLEEAYGSLHKPGMKYIPIEKARKIAGKALAKKYGIT